MTEPIMPQDMKSIIPDEVIEAFNELIQKKWNGFQAQFKQDEAIVLIATKMNQNKWWVIEHHHLDVEDLYRQVGWIVEYDKPGYNEFYSPTFMFSKKKVKDD